MRVDRIMILLLALLAAAGCVRQLGPVPIRIGTPCAFCGMEVQDLSFACETMDGGKARIYDSIECLLRDDTARARPTYLPDYDSRSLHEADSLWIVKGSFPTPMGGGVAAFLRHDAADEVALRAHGIVGRWSEARALLAAAP